MTLMMELVARATYKFAFIVDSAILGNLGNGHVFVEPSDRGARLDEDGRIRRRLAASLPDYTQTGQLEN